MNTKVTIKTTVDEEHDLTAEFCFARAAEALLGTTPSRGDNAAYTTMPNTAEEWRRLGDSIASAQR